MVNLEWYRTFKAVYQTGSLTAAAKALFISQPNVSQHLSSLEAHVGKTLFERKPRIVPTEYGKLFYTQIVEPLEKLEKVEASFNAACLKTQWPLIRLGAVQEYFQAVLAAHISDLEANLVIAFGRTHDLLGRLHKGTLDFVVATKLTDYKNIVFEPIRQERFVIAGSEGIDTTEFDQYVRDEDWGRAEAWLLSQQWFAYSADLAIIRRFWQKNFAKRPAIKPYCVIPDMNIILKSLRYGHALTIAADYLVDDEVKVIWNGHVAAENTLYLAYDKTRVTTDLVALMKQFVGI
ncbi:LysR family transcriptional regulator [Chitinophaga silvisoli]|uniref:LysR family transcriptional regulator n=1 Tax=Chitinophaga silvisoli TaxID=2291814 RepID=A0A3E1P212_9BACT|nr:LysR family transcriptional regulator [Chitinophaga silvisoli]RFM34038.1 LysR family transcriptional regulator [Chitinophaga silvisoli]